MVFCWFPFAIFPTNGLPTKDTLYQNRGTIEKTLGGPFCRCPFHVTPKERRWSPVARNPRNPRKMPQPPSLGQRPHMDGRYAPPNKALIVSIPQRKYQQSMVSLCLKVQDLVIPQQLQLLGPTKIRQLPAWVMTHMRFARSCSMSEAVFWKAPRASRLQTPSGPFFCRGGKQGPHFRWLVLKGTLKTREKRGTTKDLVVGTLKETKRKGTTRGLGPQSLKQRGSNWLHFWGPLKW